MDIQVFINTTFMQLATLVLQTVLQWMPPLTATTSQGPTMHFYVGKVTRKQAVLVL
ncbi:hypothetical protein M758_3G090300 [Ceratodon purpureus]|uniref:Uncharacterized protein n=1 Tax=Ceratodon purpureus TaxID=3225 RepID=A0A8T0IJV8_CERPU|nr:hypothetical protein KC19_3G088500 [Ceratodon purpureus]KAG0622338.1 hypothetical protein M758_3G090300 [Ceratodon purpureus]